MASASVRTMCVACASAPEIPHLVPSARRSLASTAPGSRLETVLLHVSKADVTLAGRVGAARAGLARSSTAAARGLGKGSRIACA